MSSYSDSESLADDSIHSRIIRQQADKLARMSALGDLAQEQWEKDQRAREEDTRHVMDAEEVGGLYTPPLNPIRLHSDTRTVLGLCSDFFWLELLPN